MADSSQPGTGVSTSAADNTPASLGYTADPNQAGEDKAYQASGQASGYLDANGNPTSTPTQAGTYQDTLNSFQKEIDGLNTASAQAKSDITTQNNQANQAALGANRALQARSGELGSSFGQGQTSAIQQTGANKNITDLTAQDAKDQAAMSALDDKIRTQANTDYNNKITAYGKGADSALAYLQGKSKTATANGAAFGTEMFNQGFDPTDPKNAAQLNAYAKQIGVDSSVLVNSYSDAKNKADTAAAATAEKENKTLAPGATDINTSTGATVATGQPKVQSVGRGGELVNTLTGAVVAHGLPPAAGSGSKVTNVTYQVQPDGTVSQVTTVNGKVTKTVQQKETSGKIPSAGIVSTALSNLKSQVGGDNGVSPDTWNDALQQWLSAGYSLSSFKSNFGSFAKNSASNPKGSPLSQFNGE